MSLNRTWYNALVNGPAGTLVDKNFIDAILDEVDAALGLWTDVPFNAANFTGAGAMVWTVDAGDVVRNRYKITDKLIVWQVMLATTTTSGTANATVNIAAPAGVTLVSGPGVPAVLPNSGYTVTSPSGTNLTIVNNAGVFTIATNGVYVYFTYIGQVV